LGGANRRFEFQKRSQFFICVHSVTLSVAAMGVSNPYRKGAGGLEQLIPSPQ
jgi:hypothetical protein